jgi:hypothetical protein
MKFIKAIADNKFLYPGLHENKPVEFAMLIKAPHASV